MVIITGNERAFSVGADLKEPVEERKPTPAGWHRRLEELGKPVIAAILASSEDIQEGRRAFIEKRKPRWKGR